MVGPFNALPAKAIVIALVCVIGPACASKVAPTTAPATATAEPDVRTASVAGATLHYVDEGSGAPVVFVHGGLVDYRRWDAQRVAFVRAGYRFVSYSRRFNFPNTNRSAGNGYSAAIDADDLAELVNTLRLGPVHVISESYGSYAALLFAMKHPELVRSLVLAEAPLMRWLDDSPDGKAARDDFLTRLWQPVGAALRKGDQEAAMRVISSFFFADRIPPEVRRLILQNLGEWRELTQSRDVFPAVAREDVSHITVPVLLMSGERTLELHKIVDGKLERLIPHATRVVVAGATHEMWDEKPDACRAEALAFFAMHSTQAGATSRPEGSRNAADGSR